jgi:hypothetical protein
MKNKNSHTYGQPSFSSQKKIAFTLITSIICFIVCFFIMEVVARLIRPKIDLYELTGRIPGPNPMTEWALVDAFSAYRGKPGPYPGGKKVNMTRPVFDKLRLLTTRSRAAIS